MISLITGNPGMGKTSLMIYMLLTRSDLKGRPVYIDGIPNLSIPHEPIPEGHDVKDWFTWVTPGSILVIDEAQRIFRTRPAGSKVPDYVQELETHRHYGVDIFILTQHPRLLDVNVRSLTGEHRHISRTRLGLSRVAYWTHCANPESRMDLKEADISVFRIKKSVFGLYKSAEEHTKIKMKNSLVIYVLPITLTIVLVFSFLMYHRYKERMQPIPVQHPSAQQQPEQPVPQSQYGNIPSNNPASAATAPEKTLDFNPMVEGQAWTAPAYRNQLNVQSMPFPVACVKNGHKCTCYTDQATPLLDMKISQCLEYVEHGIYNPYKAMAQSRELALAETPTGATGGAVVMSLDGKEHDLLKKADTKLIE